LLSWYGQPVKSVNESIFNFNDYRDFIKSFYQDKKSVNKSYSFAVLGNRAFLSKMAIKHLVDKKRHLDDNKIEIFADALGLKGKDKQYFKNLVLFNKKKNFADKNEYFMKMLNCRDKKEAELILTQNEMSLFNYWYQPIISEMSCLKGFKEETGWIRERLEFKVSEKKIAQALDFLKNNGHLKNSKLTRPMIKAPDGIKSYIYKKYVMDQIEKSKEAVEKQQAQDRQVFNLTISVNEERFEVAKKMILDFRHKLHEVLSNDEEGDRVIQVNMQMFTASKNKENNNFISGGNNETSL